MPVLRLPLNDAARPYAGELLRTVLAVLAADGEEAGLISLRTAFEVNKAFRQQLEEHAPAFLEIVRKARPFGFGPSALCHTAWRKCLIPWAGLPVCDSSAVLLCTHAHVHMLCHAWMCHFHLHCAE